MAACLFNTTVSEPLWGKTTPPEQPQRADQAQLMSLSRARASHLKQNFKSQEKCANLCPFIRLTLILSSGKTNVYSSLCAGMYVVQFMDVHSM